MLVAVGFAVGVQFRRTATIGWPSLGWTTTKPGPWKASWKDSPEPRPMSEPILKVLLICGCRFRRLRVNEGRLLRVGQSASSPLSGPGTVSSFGGVWSEPEETRLDMSHFRCASFLT